MTSTSTSIDLSLIALRICGVGSSFAVLLLERPLADDITGIISSLARWGMSSIIGMPDSMGSRLLDRSPAGVAIEKFCVRF